MSNERAHLSFDDDDGLDLTGFVPKKKKGSKARPDPKDVEAAAEKSGFTSREPKRRRTRKYSPYQAQLNLKCRKDIKPLFHEIGSRLDVLDYTTFEQALLALIEKHGYSDLEKKFKDITQKDSRSPIL